MSTKSEYIFEIHYIRALASLMVLLVHVSATYFYQQGQQFNDYTFFINQVSRFGTPVFAVISGFLLFYQTRKRGFNLKKFISSRLTKIGIPFIVWSSFYFLFTYLILDINPMKDGLNTFFLNLFSGNAFYHLYFISIVFQFYLFFPLLQFFRSKLAWLILLPLTAMINLYFLKVDVSGQVAGILAEPFNLRAFLPAWIYFFIFGGFLAYYWDPLITFSRKFKITLSIAAVTTIFLAVLEYRSEGSLASNRASNLTNIPILILFLAGIMGDLRKITLLDKFLKEIGSLSMAIYLVHPFVINIYIKVAPEILWKTSLFPVTFGLILLGSIIMTKLIQLLPFSSYILTVPKIKDPNHENQVQKQKQKSPMTSLVK